MLDKNASWSDYWQSQGMNVDDTAMTETEIQHVLSQTPEQSEAQCEAILQDLADNWIVDFNHAEGEPLLRRKQ